MRGAHGLGAMLSRHFRPETLREAFMKNITVLAAAVSGLVLTACAARTREVVVTPAPAPTTVQVTPAPTAVATSPVTSGSGTLVVTDTAPPAPQSEAPTPAPYSNAVWMAGYW